MSLVAGVAVFGGFCLAPTHGDRPPLILPSLLKNRGFTAGLLVGLAYFAAVNGFAYVCSLFFQTALGLSPSHAAIGLAPLMAGIIVASIVGRPLISMLGRQLVVIGLITTLIGASGLWATVYVYGVGVHVLILGPSLLVLGSGMGACFSSIFDIAIGDVAHDEAGSASGSLSAVQQLAAAIGAAVVTSVYFTQRAQHGAAHAMTASVVVVGAIATVCLGLVWLLPKRAAEDPPDAV